MPLDPQEIDKERGVVIEEWRGGLGAGSRLRDQQIPVLYYQSKYAERLPIGKPEILKSFPPRPAAGVLHKWYRPDRMAVVVVGDLDPAKMEALISAAFGRCEAGAAAPPRRSVSACRSPRELLFKVADRSRSHAVLGVDRAQARRASRRIARRDYRRSLVQQLVLQMINDRFDEISRKPDAPFLTPARTAAACRRGGRLSRSARGVQDGKIEAGLAALAIEAKRVKRVRLRRRRAGSRARSGSLAGYERAYTERDKTESGSYAQEYVNHFLEGEPSPGIAYEYELAEAASRRSPPPTSTPPERCSRRRAGSCWRCRRRRPASRCRPTRSCAPR